MPVVARWLVAVPRLTRVRQHVTLRGGPPRRSQSTLKKSRRAKRKWKEMGKLSRLEQFSDRLLSLIAREGKSSNQARFVGKRSFYGVERITWISSRDRKMRRTRPNINEKEEHLSCLSRDVFHGEASFEIRHCFIDILELCNTTASYCRQPQTIRHSFHFAKTNTICVKGCGGC